MAKSIRARILEALEKEPSTRLELSRGLRLPLQYVTWELSILEEKGLIKYDISTAKWRPKKR